MVKRGRKEEGKKGKKRRKGGKNWGTPTPFFAILPKSSGSPKDMCAEQSLDEQSCEKFYISCFVYVSLNCIARKNIIVA